MSELRRGGDLRPILLICTIAALAYGAYALVAHLNYWSGLDLGLFSQAVWHYSNFDAPLSTVKGGVDLRADHFHPILMTLAPLYWIADEPALLLVAQGVLVAARSCPSSCSRPSGSSGSRPTQSPSPTRSSGASGRGWAFSFTRWHLPRCSWRWECQSLPSVPPVRSRRCPTTPPSPPRSSCIPTCQRARRRI